MRSAPYYKFRALLDRWTTPPAPPDENIVRYWQDRLLFTLLLIGSSLGLLVYVPSVILCIKEKLWFVGLADTMIYAWVVVLFFKRSLPFSLRSHSIVYMAYTLGVILMWTPVSFAGGPVWLFAFPVLAAIFMGIRTSLMALIINALTILTMGILHDQGVLPGGYEILSSTIKWVVVSLNFIFLNGVVAVSAGFIAKGLMISLGHEKIISDSLEQEHHKLLEFNRQLELEIVERKHVEEALRQQGVQQRKLESRLNQAQKMEAIGILAGGIAHDFNNILSSVIGYTELAMEDVEKGTPLENDLKEVYKAGNRAKDLVGQILTFARQDDERSKPTRISSIVKEATKMLRSAIPSTVDIVQDIQSDSLVMADPTQIHQVFMNLSTNAAQAMEDEGGVLRIGLYDEKINNGPSENPDGLKPGTYLKIEVSDTGKGIPEAHLDSIFNPYFTTKKAGEGTGLGLAVVHGIVKKCGGSISVHSEQDQGSVFRIHLPVVKNATKDVSTESEALPPGNERILLVDDEISIVRMASQRLGRLGYSVTSRNNSLEALELFRARPAGFDLVITDMTMPHMTGDKLAQELMAIRADIPVILCTGYSKRISEEIAVHMGIKALVHKPISNATMAKTVRKVLDEK